MDSGLVTSKSYYTFTPQTNDGTAGTVHAGGLLFLPFAKNAVFLLEESGIASGNLTDLTPSGNLYAIGSIPSNASVPNYSTMGSGANKTRLAALGVRVTYEGTELNRAGRYYAGLCPINSPAQAGSATPFPLSPLSTICSSYIASTTVLRRCMSNYSTARVADGTFEFTWAPSTTPSYQQDIQGTGYSTTFPLFGSTGNQYVTPSYFNGPIQGNCVESGQNALVFWVEGDNTSAVTATGNAYAIEVIWHWEVVPGNSAAVPYTLSLSPYDVSSLARTLNTPKRLGDVGAHANTSAEGVSYATQSKSSARRQISGPTTTTNNIVKKLNQLHDTVRRLGGPDLGQLAGYAVKEASRRAVTAAARAVTGSANRRRIEL